MNYLNCKKCDMAVVCDDEATSVTCSLCCMADVITATCDSEDIIGIS